MIGGLVAKLIAAGTPPELAAIVVAEAFAAGAAINSTGIPPDSAAEKRRAYDRQRKRKSTGIPPESTGTSQMPLSKSLDLEEKREAEQAEFRGAWCPHEADWIDAIAKLGEQVATSELAKFREINRRPAGSKRDSDWRVWVVRAVEYAAKQKPATVMPVDKNQFWDLACASFKRTNRWHRDAGPDPESPSCRCPPEVLQKYGLRAA